MHLHLVLPGLIWPGAQTAAPAKNLELPALSRLLGQGRIRLAPAQDMLAWLLARFHLDPQTASIACLRRLGEERPADYDAAEDRWLCADPVNLRFAGEHLVLADASTLDIQQTEAAALIDTLNECFADLGHFEACAAQRWYLRANTRPLPRFVSLGDASGRPVARSLPEDEEAREWRRILSEIQIVLHNHPANRKREEAGLPLINSLWPWGAGIRPTAAQTPCPAIQSAIPEVRGLARLAGVLPLPPDPATALSTPTLAVLDELAVPALHRDLAHWRAGLTHIEHNWFAPLHANLRDGRLKSLTIEAPGERASLTCTVHAHDRWKFWRRPLTLDALHERLPDSET